MIQAKPLIPYGWLRALLFFIFFLLVIVLLRKAVDSVVPFVDAPAAGATGNTPGYLDKSLWLSVLITFASAFLCTGLFRTYVDRQSFRSLGFVWVRFESHALTGFFLAIAMLGLGTLALVLLKYINFSGVEADGAAIIINVGLMLLVAISEELVFRGYLLNNLMQSTNKWIALAVSALLFTVVHAGNPGAGVLPLIEIFIGGIMLGINYIYTKNLWFGIFLHFSWNFFQGPILGYKVSGLDLQPVLQQTLNGPDAYTGGAFGFEGSVLSMILNIAVVAILVWVYEKKRLSPVN